MAVPNFQSLMLPTLQCLQDGKEWSVPLCANVLKEKLNLTPDDMGELLPSGKQVVINNRIGWAIKHMQRALLLNRSRHGFYRITERGLSVLNKNPPSIDMSFLSSFQEYIDWKNSFKRTESSEVNSYKSQNTEIESLLSPEEQIGKAYQTITEDLKNQLLEYLVSDLVSPSLFERIIVDLLIAMGYGGGREEMGKALGQSGDGGVDGVIKEDTLGLDMVYIQAKKYKLDNSIGQPAIRDFVGSLEGFKATKGVFVTTSSFSKTAKEFAEKVSKKIALIDGEKLSDLMIRYNVGVREKDSYVVKRLDEEYFSE
jgi:restriction system protein